MKQFCIKIDLISQGRENALSLPANMAAMTSHECSVKFVRFSFDIGQEKSGRGHDVYLWAL